MESLLQILFYGGLFFLMMRFGCGKHMFGHGSKHKDGTHAGGHGGNSGGGKPNITSTGTGHHSLAPPEKDVDAVCGKTVLTSRAKSSFHDGLVYYFCSGECREVFESSPAEYVDRERKPVAPRLQQRPAEETDHV